MQTLVLLGALTLGSDLKAPAAILATAVAQFETCSFEQPKRTGRNDEHEETLPLKIEKKDTESVNRLSVSSLFRTNRFLLEDKGLVLLNRREVMLLNFTPRPEKSQLPAQKSEDKDFIRVINRLSGSIYIDLETGRFAQIDARLKEPYGFFTFKKIIPLPVIMSEVMLTLKPESDELSEPNLLLLEFDGHGPKKIKRRHEHFAVRFNCN